MDLEQRLRTDLAGRAHEIEAPPGVLDSVFAGYRRQNRRRAGLLAAGVCAAVAAVTIPLGHGGGGGGDGAPGRELTASTVGYEAYPVAPRGDLVDDGTYVDGLLARDWYPSPEMPEPAPETRQVLFAGTVSAGVRALVSGWEDGRRTGLWLHGPAGADPAELEPMGDATPLPDGESISLLSVVDGRGALVVLARPGDLVEVSSGVEVAADGSTVRAPFQPVGDADGLAVVDAAGLSSRSLAVRISRDGRVLSEGPAGSAIVGGGSGAGDSFAPIDGAAGEPDPVLVQQLADGVLEELDLTPEQVDVDVLWGGPIGNGNRPDVIAAALAVRLPTGAVVAVGGYSDVQQPDGGDQLTSIVPCLRQVLPAGTALTSVAMRCDLYGLEDGANLGSQLVVVPPQGTTQLRLVGASGAVLDTRPLDGPAWVGPAPDGLGSVTALDAGGQVLAEIPLGSVQNLRD